MDKQELKLAMQEIANAVDTICDEYLFCDECPLHLAHGTTVPLDGAKYYIGACMGTGIQRVYELNEGIVFI